MRLISLAVVLTVGLTLAPLAREAQSAGKVFGRLAPRHAGGGAPLVIPACLAGIVDSLHG